jgi:hypothetical protein
VSDDWSARSTVFTAGGGRHSRRSRRPAGLNNWRRHKEDRAPGTRTWSLDKYSSAISFTGWAERSEWIVPEDYEPLPVCAPQSWLLREGWKLGGPISVYEVPGRH